MPPYQISLFSSEILIDHSRFAYPCRLHCVVGQRSWAQETSSYYGYVQEGTCDVASGGNTFHLSAGMYFGLAGPIDVNALGQTVVIERYGYRTLAALGGPIEIDGRLSYIDMCRATILLSPARQGDPVLNLLIFPPGIKQSMHLHPSSRLGIVAKGSGAIVTPGEKTNQSLTTSCVFGLSPFAVHCFHSGPEGLTVIAFHPDSDVGPTDERHPMKSRTYQI